MCPHMCIQGRFQVKKNKGAESKWSQVLSNAALRGSKSAPSGVQLEPLRGQNGTQICSRGPRGAQKRSKMGRDETSERQSAPTRPLGQFWDGFGVPEREPKWSQIGTQNESKFGTAFGAISDANLIHFGVSKWSKLSRASETKS